MVKSHPHRFSVETPSDLVLYGLRHRFAVGKGGIDSCAQLVDKGLKNGHDRLVDGRERRRRAPWRWPGSQLTG